MSLQSGSRAKALPSPEENDFLNDQASAYKDLGDVLELAGKRDEASVALEYALALYERKGNLVMVQRVRTRLAELKPSGASGEKTSA